MNRLLRILSSPAPHYNLVRGLVWACPGISYESRVEFGAVRKGAYAYCLL